MSISVRRRAFLAAVLLFALVGATLIHFRRAGAPDQPATVATAPAPAAAAAPEPAPEPTPKAAPSKAAAPNAPGKAKPTWSPDPLGDRLESVATNYDNLVARAKAGDAAAALDLSDALHTCATVAPLTPAALEDHIKQAAADNPVDSSDYADAVMLAKSEFRQCSRFATEQIDAWRTWLALAAATGDAHARLAYVELARPTDTRSDTYFQDTRDFVALSRKYLNEEVAAGDVAALLATSANYGEQGAGVFGASTFQEYAYLYAYCLAKDCGSVELGTLSKLATHLSSADLSNAVARGRDIYAQCCTK